MRPLLLAVTALVSACSAADVEMRGRQCAEADTPCLSGFTCDPETNRCVTTGDPCAPELALLPCATENESRECRDGVWGECAVALPPTPPAIEGVADLCDGQDSTVTWETADEIDYEIRFYNGSDWVEPTSFSLDDGTATQAALTVGANYKWRIRVSNNAGTNARESSVFEVFALPNNPLLAVPEPLCDQVPASTSWTAEGGITYEVQFWNGFDWIAPDSQTNDSATVVPPGPRTDYRWQLRARRGECNAADWRQTTTFAVEPWPEIYRAGAVTNDNTTPEIQGSWKLTDGCEHDIRVQRSDSSPPMSQDDGVSVTTGELGFTDSSVSVSTLYYYRPFVVPTGLPNDPIPGPILAAEVPTTSIHPKHVATGDVVLDGVASEDVWNDTAGGTELIIFNRSLTGQSGDNIATTMRFAWDDQCFIFFVRLTDQYLYADDTDVWRDDSIELFFDMSFDRTTNPGTDDFHFIIPVEGDIYSARGSGTEWDSTFDGDFSPTIIVEGTVTNNTDQDTGWAVEGRIPFTMLGVGAFSAPTTIGFAFWVNEDDLDDHYNQHAYKWTEGSLGGNPSTWGLGQFSEPTAY